MHLCQFCWDAWEGRFLPLSAAPDAACRSDCGYDHISAAGAKKRYAYVDGRRGEGTRLCLDYVRGPHVARVAAPDLAAAPGPCPARGVRFEGALVVPAPGTMATGASWGDGAVPTPGVKAASASAGSAAASSD